MCVRDYDVLGWVCCALGYVCSMFHWVPRCLLCCMTLGLALRPCHGIHQGMTAIWAFPQDLSLPLLLLLHFSCSLACSHTHSHFHSQSNSLLTFVKSFSHSFLLNSLSPPHPLTTCPSVSRHLTFCSSLSVLFKYAALYLLSISYLLLPLCQSCVCLNLACPLYSISLQSISIFSTALVTLTAGLAPASRPELNSRRCIFTSCQRFMHAFQKTNRTCYCILQKAPSGPDCCRLSTWLFK